MASGQRLCSRLASPGASSSITARNLAAVLGVNTNTVLRALRLLRDEGVLEFRRGRSIHVTGDALPKSAVLAKARELVELARREGYRRDDLIDLIGQLT